jgi:hypothetical protein
VRERVGEGSPVFSRREKILLLLAAAAVAVVVSIQFSGTIGGASRQGPTIDVRQVKALQQRVDDAEARLRKATLPASEATARILRAAQASGSATGVTVASARPRTPIKMSSGCLEQALEIQATGPFPNIARFMYDLEAKNANLRIARVAISSSDAASDKVNCAVTVAGYSPGVIKQWQRNQPQNQGRVRSR